MSDPLASGHLIRNVQLVPGDAAIDTAQALPTPAAKAAPFAPHGSITVPDDDADFEVLDDAGLVAVAGSSTDGALSSTVVAGSSTDAVTSAAPANGDDAVASSDGNGAASPDGNESEKGEGKGKDKGDAKAGNWRKRFKQSPPE